MSHDEGNIAGFGMDTCSLVGPLEARLQAMRQAGFTQAVLSASDLASHPLGWDAARQAVQHSGLQVTAFKGLQDFEGLSGALHAYKVDMAKSLLESCRSVGCRVMVVKASALADAVGDADALARDLRKLALLAIPMGIRVAYEPLADARCVTDFPLAWDLVCQADMPNLGLALSASNMFASGTSPEELDMLVPAKIFLVQLSDPMADPPGVAQPVPALFPGEGVRSQALAAMTLALHQLGYRGPYSFDVANSDYRQLPPAAVALRARRAALWLGEGVLRRSVPLPNQIRLRR